MTRAATNGNALEPRIARRVRALAAVPAVAVLLLALLAACGSIDEVDITRSASGTVPGAAGGPPLAGDALGTLDLAIDRGTLRENGVDPEDVDSARLVGLRLEISQGGGTSFEAWLDSVSFHVEAPGLPRVLVAQKDGIGSLPPGTTAVDLDTLGVDLKPYVVAESAKVTAEASGTQPAADTTIRATATVRVDVNVTGLFH